MSLKNLYNKLSAIESFDPVLETSIIINKYEWYVSGLIRLQLQQGLDSDDKPVTIFGRDYYADRTIFDKTFGAYAPLGKITEWITNYKHGDFYRSLKTVSDGRVFYTESDVPYFNEILIRSGDTIIKLSKSSKKDFIEEVLLPELRTRFKELSNGI